MYSNTHIKLRPRRPRSILLISRVLHPPGSGVPAGNPLEIIAVSNTLHLLAGANAGSGAYYKVNRLSSPTLGSWCVTYQQRRCQGYIKSSVAGYTTDHICLPEIQRCCANSTTDAFYYTLNSNIVNIISSDQLETDVSIMLNVQGTCKLGAYTSMNAVVGNQSFRRCFPEKGPMSDLRNGGI